MTTTSGDATQNARKAQQHISFRSSAAAAFILPFGDSPYLTDIHLEESPTAPIESLYALREDHPVTVTNTDIIEQMQVSSDSGKSSSVSAEEGYQLAQFGAGEMEHYLQS